MEPITKKLFGDSGNARQGILGMPDKACWECQERPFGNARQGILGMPDKAFWWWHYPVIYG